MIKNEDLRKPAQAIFLLNLSNGPNLTTSKFTATYVQRMGNACAVLGKSVFKVKVVLKYTRLLVAS
jgi:hypothetical protein